MQNVIMWMWNIGLIFVFISPIKGDCETGCDLPIDIYEQLKCSPKYEKPNDCCPKEYDCSHIYKRPAATCHLRGKFYKPGDNVLREESAENCVYRCYCSENSVFRCTLPQQNCQEYYVAGYPKDGCYLKYALDSCCATEQVCPPFDEITKCEVNGKIYMEGQRFPHPKAKCTKCVCSEGLDGKFAEPFCQKKNCTTEIKYSKEIDKYCAPYYVGGTCCPTWWICPAEGGEYITSKKVKKSELQCRFGDKMMDIGSKYLYQDIYTAKLICECIVPPFLSCFEEKGE